MSPIIHSLLIQALIAVETGGHSFPDDACGDFVVGQPTAFGCLQVTEAVLIDVSRISGRPWDRRDMYNRQSAIKVCLIYLNHYGDSARLGHEATMEDLARIWNGGPQGWNHRSTEAYWAKVRRELDRMAGVWRSDYSDFIPAYQEVH